MLATRPVGNCPDCETSITDRHVLIEYETATGPAMFAECPGCLDVVHPQH